MGMFNRHNPALCMAVHFLDAQYNHEKTLAESVSLLSGTTRSYFSAVFLMR